MAKAGQSIVKVHPKRRIRGTRYDFAHLAPFVENVRHEDAATGDGFDIRVRISFQSHAFSKAFDRAPGTLHDFIDESGNKRIFCQLRYQSSFALPGICRRLVGRNGYTWVMRDRNRASNMAIVEDTPRSGHHYAIFYYLFPSAVSGIDVEFVVKTAYHRDINFEHIKRKYKVQSKIRECYFKGRRIP